MLGRLKDHGDTEVASTVLMVLLDKPGGDEGVDLLLGMPEQNEQIHDTISDRAVLIDTMEVAVIVSHGSEYIGTWDLVK